ncbi:unnamed protein product [Amoebophrya sp. A120]|nr:unnamed protein product [Amoebophrya sp. A120]|eukprot:GSA120T00023092001.1
MHRQKKEQHQKPPCHCNYVRRIISRPDQCARARRELRRTKLKPDPTLRLAKTTLVTSSTVAKDKPSSPAALQTNILITAKRRRFESWLRDHCKVTGLGNIFLGTFQTPGSTSFSKKKVRGLGARKAFSANAEELVCTPTACSVGGVVNLPERFKQLGKRFPESCPDSVLGKLWLAEELTLGEDSWYAPYLEFLPPREAFQHHPATIVQSREEECGKTKLAQAETAEQFNKLNSSSALSTSSETISTAGSTAAKQNCKIHNPQQHAARRLWLPKWVRLNECYRKYVVQLGATAINDVRTTTNRSDDEYTTTAGNFLESATTRRGPGGEQQPTTVAATDSVSETESPRPLPKHLLHALLLSHTREFRGDLLGLEPLLDFVHHGHFSTSTAKNGGTSGSGAASRQSTNGTALPLTSSKAANNAVYVPGRIVARKVEYGEGHGGKTSAAKVRSPIDMTRNRAQIPC